MIFFFISTPPYPSLKKEGSSMRTVADQFKPENIDNTGKINKTLEINRFTQIGIDA